jgi:nitrogen fixation NifU-like protein
MDDLYREQILDHFKHPRNFGKLGKATTSAKDNLVSCGDSLSMELRVENKTVKDIKFEGTGCAISMASASMLTELVKEKSVRDLKKLTKNDILTMLGINPTPTRLKCALLSLEVLHKALNKLKHG